jgi:hypothetical protein
MGTRERKIISDEYEKVDSSAPYNNNISQVLGDLDCYYWLNHYFETDEYIFFGLLRGGTFHTFLFDKTNSEIKMALSPSLDLILKSEFLRVNLGSRFLQADDKGLFYMVESEYIDHLRTAARDGMLLDNLDKLDELKALPDDSNPVILYLKYRD